MKKQTYKVIITFDADVEDGDPKDWLPAALEEGYFKYKTHKIFSTEVEPIDKEAPEHKWIKDFK
jgi:hypothetical protein